MAFRFSFRALSILLELLATSEEVSSSSSRGIRPLDAPLPFDRLRVHSRKPRLPSGRRCQPSTLVPPSWFLTTSTVSSTQGLRVCCTPLPALEFDAFPVPASRSPESVLQVLRVPRAAGHTLRRVPLISSRTASLRPLPSCHCCTQSSPGPARPEPSTASSLQPKLSGRCRSAFAGRSPCQRSTTLRAEAVEAVAQPVGPRPSRLRALAGRGRRGRVLTAGRGQDGTSRRRGPRPPSTRLAGSPRRSDEWSGLSGDRGRRPTPEGADSPHRPGPVWRPPLTEVGGSVEEPVRCLGDAPIRRGGPPRHQPGASSGPANRPAPPPSRVVPGPEGPGPACVGDDPTERCEACRAAPAEAVRP
jgi:hypothetical protein